VGGALEVGAKVSYIPIAPARKGPWFLCWYDDSPKHTLAQKAHEAAQAYRDRFGAAPTLARVNPGDVPETFQASDYPCPVELVSTVQRNTVWIGREE
jgi:hypothetical protein